MSRMITLVLVTATLVATLMPLVRAQAWWIRVFDFPRLQIVGGALLSGIGVLWLKPLQGAWGLVGVGIMGLCAVYQFFRILPYTPLRPKQVADSAPAGIARQDRQVAIMVANVLMTNRNAVPCLDAVRDCQPDILLVVETDQWWLDQLRELEQDYPYNAYAPLPNTYGLLVFSRLELRQPEIRYLIDDEVPSFRAGVVLDSGEELCLYCLHPKPPAPAEAKTSTRRDAELLLVGQEIADHQRPTIVAGDLNDVAWSHTSELFRRTSGLLDPRIGRGLMPTFHADYSLLRWPLDHIFHSPHFKVMQMSRLAHIGSDHFPICITLSYEPADKAKQAQGAAKPDAADQQEAQENIAAGIAEEERKMTSA